MSSNSKSASLTGGLARKAGNIGFNISSVILLIAVWQLICTLTGVNTALFPNPVKTWDAFIEIIGDGSLADHITSSMYRFFVGFVSSTVVAVALGLIFGRIGILFRFINPVL